MEKTKITKEQLSEIITKFIDIIEYAMEFDIQDSDSGGYIANLSGENLGALIGFHGKNISSIEHIINLMALRAYSNQCFISIDINDYRKNRLEIIKKYVENAIKEVEKTRRPYNLYPMSAFERLFVHKLIQENPDLTTQSFGEEPARYVTISVKEA